MDENNNALIANTYKIIGELGSGGGGVVYLAEHTRLGKRVVLKKDKRALIARPESLRREVDALKNLRHVHIPQVYDFIEEDGIVYTVMEYIEGESLDKKLERGERFSRAQVIKWACHLLEALKYLHGRKPHPILHADIKPANIMITPQGEAYLIDFNIALALTNEGAAAVGLSPGYASPEHYTLGYLSSKKASDAAAGLYTDIMESETGAETVVERGLGLTAFNRPEDENNVSLDARSDIYSAGAALYHLITGKRPAESAAAVKPISPEKYSPAVINIITKAMKPDPEARWQSAGDMLNAFLCLRANDPRVKKYKKIRTLAAVLLSFLFITGAGSVFYGQRRMTQIQEEIAATAETGRQEQEQAAREEEERRRLAQAVTLSEQSAGAFLRGDTDAAVDYALQACLLTDTPIPQAQKALTDALMVYDLSDGFKNHKTLELPSAPFFVDISPDGALAAAVYAYTAAVIDTRTGAVITRLAAEPSALSEARFADNNTLIYAGPGALRAYDITEGRELWIGEAATAVSVSADGRVAAAVYKDRDTAYLYDAAGGQVLYEIGFEDKRQRVPAGDILINPGGNIFTLNSGGTMLAVSFADGSLWVYDLPNGIGIEILGGESGYTHFSGGFYEHWFAFAANSAAGSVFSVIDTYELTETVVYDHYAQLTAYTDTGGIYLQTENYLASVDPVTREMTDLVSTPERIDGFAVSGAYTLAAAKDELVFFDKNAAPISRHAKVNNGDILRIAGDTAVIAATDSPVLRIMRYAGRPYADLFTYDPAYIHDEARISADGGTLMLYSVHGFRLYGANGELIAEVSDPDAFSVHDQRYIRGETGSRLEVIYKGGLIRTYSAADGSLLSEAISDTPNALLTGYDEVFITGAMRIEAPLHGTPAAYDINTGRLIRELEKDALLIYVAEIGEYTVTDYISINGDRFGLLLDRNCETLAYLPNLYDVSDDKLIFSYPGGYIRETRVYGVDELIGMAGGG